MVLVLGVLAGCLPLLQDRGGAGEGQAHPEHVVVPATTAVGLLFLGASLCVPWLLDRLGRRSWRGLAVRLALRDAGRTRGRATGAVCAMMALVTLAGAWLTAVFGLGADEVRDWTPQGPPGFGSVTIQAPAPVDPGNPDVAAPPATLTASQQRRATTELQRTFGAHVPVLRTQQTQAVTWAARPGNVVSGNVVVVGDAGTLRFWLRREPPAEAVRTLEQGGAVVLDRKVETSEEGSRVALHTFGDDAGHTVAAVVVDAVENAPTVVSPATARRLHLGTGDTSLAFDAGALVSPHEGDELQAALTAAGLNASVSAESGPKDGYSHTGRVLAGVLLAVALGASGVITALTLGDARRTHEALAAIGASRLTLRRMAAVQALVTTGLGAVAGLLVGFVPMALAIAGSRGLLPLVVPWRWALAFGIALPVASGLLAWVMVRPARARAVPTDGGLQ